jgi:MarR family transcriptional regulator, 2-MHQ and catechol-resistance regulon repressor
VPVDVKSSPPRPAQARALQAHALELYRTMTAYNRFQQFRDRDHSGYHGLTIAQCYVVEQLYGKPDMTLNDLVAGMLLDKSTLSRLVDALESKGAIVRRPNPADGRSSLISVTPSGAKAYRDWVKDRVRENMQLLRSFPARQRRQMLDFLGRLTRVARSRQLESIDE